MQTHSSLPMQGFLLVSDMDGTLITGDFKLPPRNIEAIERFKAEGGLFALATGRAEVSARRYIGKLSTNAPSILYNGSMIYDFSASKKLWATYLHEKCAAIVRAVLTSFPDVGVEISCDDCIYLVQENDHTEAHIVNEKFRHKVAPLSEVPKDWLKVIFAARYERLLQVKAALDALAVEEVRYVFSCDHFYEVLPADVSKGAALRRVSEMVGIPISRVAGIGDYYNDRELITAAGIGATVQGAPEELIRQAAFVAGPCKDGAVADFIEFLERTYG